MIKVGVVGGTGYTGVELLRILAAHSDVEVVAITSRGEAGVKVADYFPSLRGRFDLAFSDPASAPLKDCDCVFFATPNGVAMSQAKALLDSGARIVDFSADFRLNDQATWEKWYKVKHASPELFSEAIYGLPEINRDKISGARLVANPGCYATAVQLALLPLVETDHADIADRLPLAHAIARPEAAGEPGKVRIERRDAAAMANLDRVAVAAAASRRDHVAVRRREDARALRRAEVHAGVRTPVVEDRMQA